MKPLLMGTVVLVVAVQATAQTLTEKQIADAIAVGRQRVSLWASVGSLDSGTCKVTIGGPAARVADAAAKAAREYRAFTRADVTDEMLAPVAVVVVTPNRPSQTNGEWFPADVEHVVLRPRDALDLKWIVQPTRKISVPHEWANGLGQTLQIAGLVADFPLDRIPSGDFDVVVVHRRGADQVCQVPATTRAMIVAPK